MIDGVASSASQYSAPVASAAAPTPSKRVPTGATMPGQVGGGIGDLQSVAPSSVARGQIVDIAA